MEFETVMKTTVLKLKRRRISIAIKCMIRVFFLIKTSFTFIIKENKWEKQLPGAAARFVRE